MGTPSTTAAEKRVKLCVAAEGRALLSACRSSLQKTEVEHSEIQSARQELKRACVQEGPPAKHPRIQRKWKLPHGPNWKAAVLASAILIEILVVDRHGDLDDLLNVCIQYSPALGN